jgi:hypothetical protein
MSKDNTRSCWMMSNHGMVKRFVYNKIMIMTALDVIHTLQWARKVYAAAAEK